MTSAGYGRQTFMTFGIRGRGIDLTEALLAHVERRLRSALSPFQKQIRQTAVQLADLQEPADGLDKQCKVTVTLAPSGKVMVKATDTDLHIAIDRAADQLERSVTLELERRAATS
jgi:ribosomal subunit interface protein